MKRSAGVAPGVEVFLQDFVHVVKGKKVGLITNPTGVDSLLESTIELFDRHSDINLRALFGPEHGISGTAQAGEAVPAAFDPDYGLPVYSLYGQTEEGSPEQPLDLDETMRLFDTEDRGKHLESQMLEDVDVLVFDLQDVGTRIYTYVATLALCMQGCAREKKEFVVLDRPNPVNGVAMEGPILEYPRFTSFVGMYPVPVRHGMTIGELAQLFNSLFLDPQVDLTVIPMKGWTREMWFEETGLFWIPPSPNIPTPSSAAVYPGQVFLEGTNVSEGRGTALPFELFGAPWIKGRELARSLNRLSLPGVSFRDVGFQPAFSKFKGELCQGCQIHVLEKDEYRPFETALYVIKTILKNNPDCFAFHPDYFDAIMGTDRIRAALLEGKTVKGITENDEPALKEFAQNRQPYLLY